jgi:hypothetical protein
MIWKQHHDGGTAPARPVTASYADGAFVLLDKVFCYPHSQARSADTFGRKEGLEDLTQGLAVHPRAGIRDGDPDPFSAGGMENDIAAAKDQAASGPH